MFVEVLVPLAVPNSFTYAVPDEFKEEVQLGCRAVVQFGRSRFYAGMVIEIHSKEPTKYKAKEIHAVLDAFPIVHEQQFALWKWIAKYYECTLGEVMQAALPSAYKIVSESNLQLSGIEIDYAALDDAEYLIVEALEIQETMKLGDLAKLLEGVKVQQVIKSLVEKAYVEVVESIDEKYKVLQRSFIRLNPELVQGESDLVAVFAQLTRAVKQEDALLKFTASEGFNMDDYSLDKNTFIKENELSVSAVKGLIEKGIFLEEKRAVNRIEDYLGELDKEVVLSPEQQICLNEIRIGLEKKKPVLLHGVTGSGKTELYFDLIKDTLAQGKQVLYLLPEIALSTQLLARLQKVFGSKVGVFHSRSSVNERAELWNDLANGTGRFQIVIGARSSVFLPFSNLGLVIVDEEHDGSFKQLDPAPRYQARDTAVVLAKLFDADVILGTATPSVESYFNATQGKYTLVNLNQRYRGTALPEVQCVDLQDAYKKKKMKGVISEYLYEQMREVIERGEQIILFQNRRGHSSVLACKTCGHAERCERCDVSLTYHKYNNELRCHYCGYSQKVDLSCSACGSVETNFKGFGTEQIAECVTSLFPNVKVGRMDLDTTRGKYAYDKILDDFSRQNIQVLVGTQMVTKGLDFGKVALVGVLNADQLLNYPDFRAFERSFQLLTQVSGRSGRRGTRGKVIIQSFTPYHNVIRQVMEHDFLAFYNDEILIRKNFHYPPFYRLIHLTLKHKNNHVLDACCEALATSLRQVLPEVKIYGPEYLTISRINSWYQKGILVKFSKENSPTRIKQEIRKRINVYQSDPRFKQVKFNLDVDPQ